MNFFKRFTSVFFCCVLLSSFFVVPVSAVDDNDYYSFPPVGGSEPSAVSLYPLNPAEFDNSDSQTLTNIYKIIQYLHLSPPSWQSNSIIGFLEKIYVRIPSNLSNNFQLIGSGRGTNAMLDEIAKWTMSSYNFLSSGNIAGNLGTIQRNTLVSADRLLSLLNAVSGINGFATENSLSTLVKFFTADDAGGPLQLPFYPNNSSTPVFKSSFKPTLGFLFTDFLYDSTTFWNGGDYTIFHYIKYSNKYLKLLQETLASEDDRQLAENYKENRQQAEQDFLSGKSGKTSLGKEDFGSLSGVGGTFKDITSLNGQASIGSFTDGLSSANETGQGWFSQATKDALDSVSESSSNVSTFSVDGDYMEDEDTYNMAGFEDHYAWLWGD